jgi:hypothetical protein
MITPFLVELDQALEFGFEIVRRFALALGFGFVRS